MLLKKYCFLNILVFVNASDLPWGNFRRTNNTINSNEQLKEKLYNDVVKNISEANTMIEDLIGNYEKLKKLYESDEKSIDISSDGEIDDVYKQKRAKIDRAINMVTTTVNPFGPATGMFYSEEKSYNDDENSGETSTHKIDVEYEELKKLEKGRFEHLNDEYLFKEKKSSYEFDESDYVQMIGNITNYTPFMTSTNSEQNENDNTKKVKLFIERGKNLKQTTKQIVLTSKNITKTKKKEEKETSSDSDDTDSLKNKSMTVNKKKEVISKDSVDSDSQENSNNKKTTGQNKILTVSEKANDAKDDESDDSDSLDASLEITKTTKTNKILSVSEKATDNDNDSDDSDSTDASLNIKKTIRQNKILPVAKKDNDTENDSGDSESLDTSLEIKKTIRQNKILPVNEKANHTILTVTEKANHTILTVREKANNTILPVSEKPNENEDDSDSLDTSLEIKNTTEQNKKLSVREKASDSENQFITKGHNSDEELISSNNQGREYTTKYETEWNKFTKPMYDEEIDNDNTEESENELEEEKPALRTADKQIVAISENASKNTSAAVNLTTKITTTTSKAKFLNPDALEFSNQDGIQFEKIKDKFTETKHNIFMENVLLQHKDKNDLKEPHTTNETQKSIDNIQHEQITLQGEGNEKDVYLRASYDDLIDEASSYSDYYGDTSTEAEYAVPIDMMSNKNATNAQNAVPPKIMVLRKNLNLESNKYKEKKSKILTKALSSRSIPPQLRFLITLRNDTNGTLSKKLISTEKTLVPKRGKTFQQVENADEKSNQSESVDDDVVIKTEQFQTNILRKAFGDVCLKVVIRKCWKSCKLALKDTCKKYACKGTFKDDFKKNAKTTCIKEFSENSESDKKENKNTLRQRRQNFDEKMTRSGYLAAACLPARRNNPPPRSNASIEQFGPITQLNILRNKYEKECNKISTNKCKNACTEAMTKACAGTEACVERKKNHFKKQCKKDCKAVFKGKKSRGKKKHHDSDSGSSSSSSSDSDKKSKHKHKHKKDEKCDSGSSDSDSSSSGSSGSSSSSSSSEDDRKMKLAHKVEVGNAPPKKETNTEKIDEVDAIINTEDGVIIEAGGSKTSTTKAEGGDNKIEKDDNAESEAKYFEDLTRNKKRHKKTKKKKKSKKNKKKTERQAPISKNASQLITRQSNLTEMSNITLANWLANIKL